MSAESENLLLFDEESKENYNKLIRIIKDKSNKLKLIKEKRRKME